MGADLYIKKMKNKTKTYRAFENSDRAVKQGYFRDCYNPYGLFSFLRANTQKNAWSWWHFSDKKEWFNNNREMTLQGSKAFKKKLLEAKEKINKKENLYLDGVEKNEDNVRDGYYPLNEKNKKEYIIWLNRLINFLDMAIEQKSTIIWSV